ncbi:MAG: hypothetical protein ABH871_09405 [Pseudomonadota bacterium]
MKEDWLGKVSGGNEKEIRKSSSNVMSALSELVVAQYLKNNGYDIIDLEAWKCENAVKPDIICRKEDTELNVEIKYIGIPPEVQNHINKQIKKKENDEVMYRDEHEIVNYLFIRIAEAALQLSGYEHNSREVWLVFATISDRDLFERCYLKNTVEWFQDALIVFDEIFKEDEIKNEIRSKKPIEWLRDANCLTLGTLKDWELKNPKKHNAKTLG